MSQNSLLSKAFVGGLATLSFVGLNGLVGGDAVAGKRAFKLTKHHSLSTKVRDVRRATDYKPYYYYDPFRFRYDPRK